MEEIDKLKQKLRIYDETTIPNFEKKVSELEFLRRQDKVKIEKLERQLKTVLKTLHLPENL